MVGYLFRGAAMIDDKVKIICSKCSMMFRERAQRIRNGFQMQCPHCLKLLTFDSSSEDAIKSARDLRISLEAGRPKVIF
jgi:hypothetical protein